MTDELKVWLISHGCQIMPTKEVNHERPVLKIIHVSNGRHSYLQCGEISQRQIREACDQLYIPEPVID